MNARRHLSIALAAIGLAIASTLAVTTPAVSSPARAGSVVGGVTPIADVAPQAAPVLGEPVVARSSASASSYRRPLFAFWGQKYNRIDGFDFQTAVRGSGTSIELAVAWKKYRGVKPLLPKVGVQARVDGGKWTKVTGAKGRILRSGLVRGRMPAFTVAAGVPAQTVDYRFKTKKLKAGPRKARRSVASKPVSVRFENQAMYVGEQARFYAPIAQLCPTASITLDTDGSIATKREAVFDWQYGITIDPAELNAVTGESEASKLAVAVHECAHARQFYNWGGTVEGWKVLVKRSAEVFVADDNPSGPTPPMQPDWEPLEHAADCATFLVASGAERTYGGWCNPAENAAASLLWAGQRY